MPIRPEMYARSRAYRDDLAQRDAVPSRYLNADGSLARDVFVVYNRNGSIRRVEDYR